MEYHTPDIRWELFGLKDFESYLKNTLVKGLLHPNVPKDITEAFIVAEYMMAHAFYHYPLYDEALSKVLRTIEMAVKIRCQELNISLEGLKKDSKTPVKKVLKSLMDELERAEPSKNLQGRLTATRNLRNALMHPNWHTYSGAMSKDFIKGLVTLLNTLFLPESIFHLINKQLTEKKAALSALRDGLCILNRQDKKYLIERIDLRAALFFEGRWHYLLVGYPIMLHAFHNLTEHSYVNPITFIVTHVKMEVGKLISKEMNDDNEIVVHSTKEPANLKIYANYLSDLNTVEQDDAQMYQQHLDGEIREHETDFYYQHLWKVKA